MPYLWRSKPAAHAALSPQDEAANCLEAGYALLPVGAVGTNEIFSDRLHALLGLAAPVRRLEQVSSALNAQSQQRFQQIATALCEGQVTPPAQLQTSEGERTLSCRTYIVPGAKEGARLGVLWLADISAEARAAQRLTQENAKLKADLRQYSTLLNMAPFPIWQRDGDLGLRFYNLAYSEIAEATEDNGGAPELDRRERALAQAALESGQPKTERRHIIVDGQRRLYSISELPVPQEKMVVGFAQDAGEIETLQEELQRYISAQYDLLESSASAMAIYGADMRLSSFNYAFAALWKLDEAWLETQADYGEILEALREKRKLPEQANFQLFKQQQIDCSPV